MNRKPLWGLWLLMIVAPVAVFCGIYYWKSLPPPLNASLLKLAEEGEPLVGSVNLSADPRMPSSYMASVLLYNPTHEKLSVTFVVESGASELALNSKGKPFAFPDGSKLAGLGIGNSGFTFSFTDINRKRTKPIRFKISWKHGADSGIKHVVITPQMKP